MGGRSFCSLCSFCILTAGFYCDGILWTIVNCSLERAHYLTKGEGGVMAVKKISDKAGRWLISLLRTFRDCWFRFKCKKEEKNVFRWQKATFCYISTQPDDPLCGWQVWQGSRCRTLQVRVIGRWVDLLGLGRWRWLFPQRRLFVPTRVKQCVKLFYKY